MTPTKHSWSEWFYDLNNLIGFAVLTAPLALMTLAWLLRRLHDVKDADWVQNRLVPWATAVRDFVFRRFQK